MTLIELISSVFLLACVILSAVRNIWTWPIGIIGVSIFFYICYESKLYADMWLQVVFLVQSIYGWYFWIYGTDKNAVHSVNEMGEVLDTPLKKVEVPIRKLDLKESIIALVSILILIVIVGYLSETYTDTDVPYLDATVASMSLVANVLLARKVIDNWVLWIIADVMYVGLFYYKELYIVSGLYVIFLVIATMGFLEWRKEWRLQEV